MPSPAIDPPAIDPPAFQQTAFQSAAPPAAAARPTPNPAAPEAAKPADPLMPNPRLAFDPHLHQTVLEFYDPATRQLRYLPATASADFPGPLPLDRSA